LPAAPIGHEIVEIVLPDKKPSQVLAIQNDRIEGMVGRRHKAVPDASSDRRE
jgi:hypothetical protein